MKRSLMFAIQSTLLLSVLATAAAPASAQSQRKDCEELKSEIAARIESNGVLHYQLQIVEPDAAGVGRIVGSCNGGTARIAYQRGAPVPDAEAVASAPVIETRAQNEL
jgi:hypothetical protein